ncbi:MAG: glycosyltransferase [Nanoarchaeota archaeon]
MISIIISSKNESDLKRCEESIKNTVGVPYEIIATNNSDGKIPLTKVYNDGAKKAKYEYVVFIHEDVIFKTKNWGEKLIRILSDKDVGVVGVAGSTYMAEDGRWYSAGEPFTKGRVIHESDKVNMDFVALYSIEKGNFDVVVLDGLFIASKKYIIKEIPFDEKTFDFFHFYDLDFTIRVAQKYRVIVTTDILVKHFSHGKFDEVWEKYKNRFLEKHKNILPFTKLNQKPDWNNIITPKMQYIFYKKDGKLRTHDK